MRLLNYQALAVDELRRVLTHGDAPAILASALRDIGLTEIDGIDSLRAVGAHLMKQGGAPAVAGALLVLIAGRTAPATTPSTAERQVLRFPPPVEHLNPSARDIAAALVASDDGDEPGE